VLGALDPAGRRHYEQHLRDCPVCREEVVRLAGLRALLGRVSPREVSGPAGGPADEAAS